MGADEYEYSPSNIFKYSLEELTRPFELTFEYVKADYKPLFAQYGIEHNSPMDWIEKSIHRYMEFLDAL